MLRRTVAAGLMALGAAAWEIRDLGRDWPIPVFVFQGDHDLNAPTELAKEWVEEIRAPKKSVRDHSGRRPQHRAVSRGASGADEDARRARDRGEG